VGDGSQDPQIIAGDKLFNFEYLMKNGSEQGKDKMKHTIK